MLRKKDGSVTDHFYEAYVELEYDAMYCCIQQRSKEGMYKNK